MSDSSTLTGNSRPWGGQVLGDCGPYTEREWHIIYRTLFDGSGDRGPLLNSGGELQVTERGAGANMSVDIADGAAIIDGLWAYSGSTVNLAVAASDPVQDRYDLVFAYWDSTTQLTQLRIVDGVLGGGSCEPVSNYQTVNVEWAVPLACVYVQAACVAINNADITDLREFCRFRFSPEDLVDGTTLTTDAATHLIEIAAGGVGVNEIAAAIAGLGLVGGGGAALDVNPDGVTLEINADQVRIAAGAAGNGLGGGGGAALLVNVDATTIVIVGDTLQVGTITHANITDRARDDYVGAGALYPASAAAVSWGTVGALTAPTEGWLLPTALDRYVIGHWETWTGTVTGNASVTVVWAHNAAANQVVTFDFTYCSNMDCGDSLVATTNITQDFNALLADAGKRICSTFTTTIAVTEEDFIDFEVGRRFSSGTDTYAGSVVLLGVVFDFTADM